MNKQTLLELLKNPEQISEADLKGLEKMVEAFPYFQAAHALLAKAAKKNGEMHADKKVRMAAAYSGERKILKRLLSDKREQEVIKTVVAPEQPVTVTKEKEKEKEGKAIETQPKVEDKTSELKQETVLKTETPVENKKEQVAEKTPSTDQTNDRFFNELQENLRKLRDMRAKLATGMPIEEKKVEEKKAEEKGTIEPANDFSREPEPKSSEKPEEKLIPEKIKEHSGNEEIFNSRLDEVVSGKKDRRDAIDEGELLLNYLSFLEMNKNTGKDKKSTDEIIERFIKQEPSISKLNPGNLPEEQEDKASASYQLKTNLASENMARIMLLQGRKDKAIEIYEQLILKYPEKKAYFVAQIEKVKEK